MPSPSPKRALVIDDEPDIRELLEITLGRMGIDTEAADSVASARRQLAAGGFDLCLTDLRLPDGSGMDVVDHIQEHCPQLPVAVISAHGSIDAAIQAMKAGAFDFVSKPIDLEKLRALVSSALKIAATAPTVKVNDQTQLLGETDVMRELRARIQKLARSQAPVYISGESGSGKEMVARLIHSLGPRANGPFVPVNCGAIPAELMESEFFGHKKGSFTGAFEDKLGLFQAAHGGTLFLDEVADLPLAMQVKLLRAIQEKAVRRVGTQEEIPVDIRILSATHKDLRKEVDAGRFRNDLFYRINVIELRVPSLRERRDDIPLLARHLLEQLADEWQLSAPTLSRAALRALEGYAFPGNVRELENILERAFTLCEDNTIEAEDLQLSSAEAPAPVAGVGASGLRLIPEEAFGQMETYLEDIERQILLAALEQCRWNRTSAAELLGISFRQIRYRLQKLGLDKD